MMNKSTYQVEMSTDGKHKVTVTIEDPGGTDAALAWAQATYSKLVKLGQAQEVTVNGRAAQEIRQPAAFQRVDAETDAPICMVHDVPMVWQQGKKGYFWSCHQKNEDGSWCSYKPSNI